MQGYVGWERGAVESCKNGERGCCELGFCVSSLFLRNVNKVILLPIWVLYLKISQVSIGCITLNLLRKPFNTIYAGVCVQPPPPALYLGVNTQVE